MTDQIRPDSIGNWLTNFESRLRKLESFPPQAMTILVNQGSNSTGAQAFTTTPTRIAATQTASFTLIRPVPVMVVPNLVFYTSGGTASYGFAFGCLFDANNNVVASSVQMVHTNGSGLSDCSHPFTVAALSAGTYTAGFQYFLDSGATTTWTAFQYQTTVFQLAG